MVRFVTAEGEASFGTALRAGVDTSYNTHGTRAGSARNPLVTAQGEKRRNLGEKSLSLKVCESHCAVSSVQELGHCEPQVCK